MQIVPRDEVPEAAAGRDAERPRGVVRSEDFGAQAAVDAGQCRGGAGEHDCFGGAGVREEGVDVLAQLGGEGEEVCFVVCGGCWVFHALVLE